MATTKTKKKLEVAPEEAEQPKEKPPKMCEVCGNEYDKAFEIVLETDGREQRHAFDSFECAIHALAPRCSTCGTRIVGHGLEKGGRMFCCAHCAGAKGATELRDRA